MLDLGHAPAHHRSGFAHHVAEWVLGAIDTVGTDAAIDVSLAVVYDRRSIATIVAFNRADKTENNGLGGSPGSAQTRRH